MKTATGYVRYRAGRTFSMRVPREPLTRIVQPERGCSASQAARASEVSKRWRLS